MPYLDTLRRYADFSGRATRFEFWSFAVVNLSLLFVLWSLFHAFERTFSENIVVTAVFVGYPLLVLIPSVAVTIRRLRDAGRSPRWILIPILPVFGAAVLLVMMFLPSKADIVDEEIAIESVPDAH